MSELTASASAIVDAPPSEVFDYICRPANHAAISGDGTVKASVKGAERLSALGDKFGMSMKMGVPYRMSSKVVEYEADSTVAWCHPGKHRWRWQVEATPEGKTKVTETFDMSTSPLKPALRMSGYPKRHQGNLEQSVANVAAHFAN